METVKRILERKGMSYIHIYEIATELYGIYFPDTFWELLATGFNLEKFKRISTADLRTVFSHEEIVNNMTEDDYTIIKLALLTNLL